MNESTVIGTPPWTREEMLAAISEFEEIYAQRPIRENKGGMRAPHMFAVWFMARKLAPDLIVESGIWKGQSTWLFEQACPQARIVAIDLDLSLREYVSSSDKVTYTDRDFSEQDWFGVTDRSLAFFDDHQNAYKRLQQCSWFGIRHVIFEDNYPVGHGDCYSLKQALSGTGFDPALASSLLRRLGRFRVGLMSMTPQYDSVRVRPNTADASALRRNLDVYHEFPPIFLPERTRWGDSWDRERYPTPPPLLTPDEADRHPQFRDDAAYYTWICYACLRAVRDQC